MRHDARLEESAPGQLPRARNELAGLASSKVRGGDDGEEPSGDEPLREHGGVFRQDHDGELTPGRGRHGLGVSFLGWSGYLGQMPSFPERQLALAALLALATSAFAADPPELDTFRPSPLAVLGATDGLAIERAGSVDGGVWLQDDVQPWVEADGVPVANRSVLTPAASVHLGYGLAFEAALPIVLADEGYDPDSLLPWEGAALGRARVRLRVAYAVRDFHIGVGVGADGPRTELLASVGGGVQVAPDLTVTWERGPVTLAAAGAARADWVTLHGGAAVQFGAAQLFLEGEAQGPAKSLGSEIRFGARTRFGPLGVEAALGASPALEPARGQPSARVWVGITGHRRVLPKRPPLPPPPVVEPAAQPAEPALTLPVQLPGLFQPGSPRFVDDGLDRLGTLAVFIEERPNLRIRVEAHMKAVPGLDDFTVSQARADRVRQALIERSIAADRIEAIGFGSGVYNDDIIEIVVAE